MKWFLKNLFSSTGEISSKRFVGVILGFNFLVYCYTNPGDIEVIKIQALTMGGLLGVGAAVDIFKKKQEKQKEEEEGDK